MLDQIVRLDAERELQIELEEQNKKSDQLAEDNRTLLDKMDQMEMSKDELLQKIKDLEIDNVSLMK